MDAVKTNDAAAVRQLLGAHGAQLKPALSYTIPGWAFGETPLIAAVRVRNREIVELLLDAGADLNERTKWWAGGFGVLDEAAGDLAFADYLIARGAVVDVHAAARLGWMERLRELMGKNAALVNARGGDGMLPLHVASSVEIARYLVESCGADINACDVDHESTAAQYMVRDRQEIARYLVARGCRTDILLAAALGDAELVEKHLAADPEAIHTCVSRRYFPMKDTRAGGSIYIWTLGARKTAHQVAHEFGHSAIYESLMARSPKGLRLAMACELGDDAAVRSLAGSSDLTADDHARLVNAARINDTAKVRLMVGAGFHVDALDDGATALHWAAFHGNAPMAEVLLDHGAPLDLADGNHGGTPLEWASYGSVNSWLCQSGTYPAVVDLLLGRGAKIPASIGDMLDDAKARLK